MNPKVRALILVCLILGVRPAPAGARAFRTSTFASEVVERLKESDVHRHPVWPDPVTIDLDDRPGARSERLYEVDQFVSQLEFRDWNIDTLLSGAPVLSPACEEVRTSIISSLRGRIDSLRKGQAQLKFAKFNYYLRTLSDDEVGEIIVAYSEHSGVGEKLDQKGDDLGIAATSLESMIEREADVRKRNDLLEKYSRVSAKLGGYFQLKELSETQPTRFVEVLTDFKKNLTAQTNVSEEALWEQVQSNRRGYTNELATLRVGLSRLKEIHAAAKFNVQIDCNEFDMPNSTRGCPPATECGEYVRDTDGVCRLNRNAQPDGALCNLPIKDRIPGTPYIGGRCFNSICTACDVNTRDFHPSRVYGEDGVITEPDRPCEPLVKCSCADTKRWKRFPISDLRSCGDGKACWAGKCELMPLIAVRLSDPRLFSPLEVQACQLLRKDTLEADFSQLRCF